MNGGLVNVIATQPELLRGICVFNQNPADYMDASRRADYFPSRMHAALWRCERARRHLSRHILDRIGGEPCLEPRHGGWPLALLDRPRLDRVALHVAAALVGARVRRSVSRTEVLQWREWLSPEAHEFALKRAGLLPVVHAAIEPQRASAQEVGLAWVAAAARPWPAPMARRFLLKLPAQAEREATRLDGDAAARIVASVLSIVESPWCSSFATRRT